ncbi:MAG: FliA/WhiG family RNA polymerase sigma factor [Oscillospiraceae bacterium]|nr:FliA/WhiG family RNA polymerase sigma factor [Oscillospiraceae bacterium]
MSSSAAEHMEDAGNLNPEELMLRYKETGDLQIRNQLVMHYLSSVKKTVMSMRSILPSNMQYEDFINQGVLALIDCIEKFDPSRGASFDTYIFKRLRGSVLSYMRKQSWLPYRVRVAKRTIQHEQEILTAKLGRKPTQKELCSNLNMKMEDYDKYITEISNAEIYSFEELLENASQLISRSNTESGDKTSPEARVMRQELCTVLQQAIEELPKREREVITLCYYENLNLREIGEVLGVSQQRASSARTSGLAKLSKKLSAYLCEKEPRTC